MLQGAQLTEHHSHGDGVHEREEMSASRKKRKAEGPASQEDPDEQGGINGKVCLSRRSFLIFTHEL